jgi:hypothetical protein
VFDLSGEGRTIQEKEIMQNSAFTPDTSTGFYAALVRDIASAIVVMGLPVAPAVPVINSDDFLQPMEEIIKREIKARIATEIENWMATEFSFADYFEPREFKDEIWEQIEELAEEKIETVMADEGERLINRILDETLESQIRRKLEQNARVELHWG